MAHSVHLSEELLPSGCGILRGALHDPSGVPVILIGNKCDKKEKVRSASQRTRSDCGTHRLWDPHLFGPCDPPVKRRLKPFRLRPFTAVSAVIFFLSGSNGRGPTVSESAAALCVWKALSF